MKFTITDTIFGKSYEIKGKEELRDWIVNLVVGHQDSRTWACASHTH